MNEPEHHDPRGGFRNPWPGANGARGLSDLLRWQWQRLRHPRAARRLADAFAFARPELVGPGDAGLGITWVGHSSFLIQVAGANILTDPVWSARVSPFPRFGPARMTPPGVSFDALPDIHAVLLSHDHYDHFDESTVRRIAARWPAAQWFAPLGHEALLRACGARTIAELDWWQERVLAGVAADLTLRALPAQHWTRRLGSRACARLWCSWSIVAAGVRIYFAGDSGYCPVFREIGARAGPFDVALIPIGAYEPRWFMKDAHMNPEEAVQTFVDVRAQHFLPMHWGTFQLTDEDPLEPPIRLRAAWQAAGLAAERLHVPAIGQTVRPAPLARASSES